MLDKHFKCPKWLKNMTQGQPRELRRSWYIAYQNYLNYKKRTAKQRSVADAE